MSELDQGRDEPFDDYRKRLHNKLGINTIPKYGEPRAEGDVFWTKEDIAIGIFDGERVRCFGEDWLLNRS